MPHKRLLSRAPQGFRYTQSMMETTGRTPSSKCKGVDSETNAYNNHHRVWLGTAAPDSYNNRVAPMFPAPNSTLNFQANEETDVNYEDPQPESITEAVEDIEHMFEKPLTPSDVGKLNRLVIPKQYAEKYFPLGDSESVEKGLLLSFEDESGKSWRFRYSYWNSSQSYVLTKGWSRFVKDKRLDAGDVVSFDRCRVDAQRLFIRWRRRAVPVQDSVVAQSVTASTAAWTQVFYSAHPYPSHLHGPLLNQPDCLHADAVGEPVVQNPMITPGNSKRLRLFGVNLDCQLDGSDSVRPDGSSLASQGGRPHFLHSQAHGSKSNHDINKGFNFSRDANHTINSPGDLSM